MVMQKHHKTAIDSCLYNSQLLLTSQNLYSLKFHDLQLQRIWLNLTFRAVIILSKQVRIEYDILSYFFFHFLWGNTCIFCYLFEEIDLVVTISNIVQLRLFGRTRKFWCGYLNFDQNNTSNKCKRIVISLELFRALLFFKYKMTSKRFLFLFKIKAHKNI